MDRLREITSVINLDLIINCILVKKGIRNAFLIQPADYDEAISNDPKTNKILKNIKKYYPELILSNINGETVVSKTSYKSSNIKSNADMGKIIGYPCAEEYDYILNHKDEPSVSISIEVNLKPGYNEDNLQILVYRCRDLRTLKSSAQFADSCERILKADPDIGRIIDSVSVVHQNIIPIKFLINKLIKKGHVTEEEKAEIKNQIWNLGLDDHPLTNYKYDYANPIHIGLLLTLLTYCNNNPMEPFWPLQYRKEQKAVDKITLEWADELLRVFTESEIKKGGKTRTRKYKF